MTAGYASALSRHPVTASAVGEVVGEMLERVGPHPDLVVVLATPGHAGAFEDVGAALQALLAPTVMVGAVATTVSVDGEDVTAGPGLVLWAGMVGPALAVGPGQRPVAPPFNPCVALVLGDASGEPLPALPPQVPVPVTVGGCSDGRGLLVGTDFGSGTATVLLGPAAGAAPLTVAGVRPVGPPLVVTRAEAATLYELDGQPAYDRLLAVVSDHLPATDLRLVDRALRVVTVHGAGPAAGVAVRGVERATGALVVVGALEEGDAVRFAVRDPAVSAGQLDAAVAGVSPPGMLALHLPGHAPGRSLGDALGRSTALAACSARALAAAPADTADAAVGALALGVSGQPSQIRR